MARAFDGPIGGTLRQQVQNHIEALAKTQLAQPRGFQCPLPPAGVHAAVLWTAVAKSNLANLSGWRFSWIDRSGQLKLKHAAAPKRKRMWLRKTHRSIHARLSIYSGHPNLGRPRNSFHRLRPDWASGGAVGPRRHHHSEDLAGAA